MGIDVHRASRKSICSGKGQNQLCGLEKVAKDSLR